MVRIVSCLSLMTVCLNVCLGAQAALDARSAEPQGGQAASLIDKVRAILAKKPSFRAKITVNGEPLDQLEVMRQLVYIAGKDLLTRKFKELATEAELAKQVKAGADPKAYVVLESEVEEKLQADAQKSGGLEAFESKFRKKGLSIELYRKLLRVDMHFDKVFFPGPRAKWPEPTTRAIKEQKNGEKFLERLPANQLPVLFFRIIRQWVVAWLQKNAKVEYAADGLDSEYCMRVNGQGWKTREALRELEGRRGPVQRELAVCAVILDSLVEKELIRRKAWLDDETIKKAFEEYRAPYDKTPFTVEVMAKSFKGFPTLSSYRRRWRMMHCFERMIVTDINDKNLKAHLERAGFFIGGGRVRTKLLSIAFEEGNRLAGVEAARVRAIDIRKRLQAKTLTLEAAGSLSPTISLMDIGDDLALNLLRTKLKETEFLDFFAPASVAEAVFYDAKQNEIYGPLLGRNAFYLAKVMLRTGAAAVALAKGSSRDLVKQDYVNKRFLAWVRKLGATVVLK